MSYFGKAHYQSMGNLQTIGSKSIFIATIFLGIAIGSAVLSYSMLFNNETYVEKIIERPGQPTLYEVLVPNEPIRAGQLLTPALFRREMRPIGGMEDKVIRSFEEIKNARTIVPLMPDTLLFTNFLSTSEAARTNLVTAKIPEGYRAVSISVDAESGVEGWAQPGAKADVVWTTIHREKPLVTTIVENAEILSAARAIEPEQYRATDLQEKDRIPPHITLLVTQEDSQKIQLAKKSGSLSLSLRGDNDSSSTGSSTITADKLLRKVNVQDPSGAIKIDGKEFSVVGGNLIPSSQLEKGK